MFVRFSLHEWHTLFSDSTFKKKTTKEVSHTRNRMQTPNIKVSIWHCANLIYKQTNSVALVR
jgi:hypothetical protein